MRKVMLVSITGLVLFAGSLQAQESTLSVDSIWGSQHFSSSTIAVRWVPDGNYYTETTANPDGGRDFVRVNAATGESEVLISGPQLVLDGESDPLTIESYQFSADGSRLLIFTNSVRVWRANTKGEFYVWDFSTARLMRTTHRDELQQFAKFSPDGNQVGFVSDNNLFVMDLRTGVETQVTSDGNENIINGTSDWVYEEELGLRDAFRISPDGRHVAFWRLDQTVIEPFYLIDETSLYPELSAVRYPKAGVENSEVRIGVTDLAGEGVTGVTWVDLGTESDIYVAQMGFVTDDELWLTRLNRHQNRIDLMLVDVNTGASRVVMTDSDEAWVDAQTPTWIDGGRKFLYLSERDGYQHIYLFNREGSLERQLTSGEWDVRQLIGVDEENDVVYFISSADSPMERQLYRVGLNGRNSRRVSEGRGTHAVSFSPTYEYYVDSYSTITTPTVQTLRNSNGDLVRVLAENETLRERVEELRLSDPEFITIPNRNGYDLNAFLIKPPDFDPSRTYPVLMYVYGGPGSQTVVDRWGGSRYLWHQMLAAQGYIVVSVDNRGTGGRGRDFKKLTYLNLGVAESDDQIAAAEYLASMPYVDGSKIGIWGWSYGGYMSSLSLFRGADVFRAAVAVAPVADWRLYDTIYTERYMRTPQENAQGYDVGAPITYADRLRGNFLVIHGTGDDNVHLQNTTQLIHALEEANRQFDMRLYPNKTHSIAGGTTRVNLYAYMTDWLWRNLHEAAPISPLP